MFVRVRVPARSFAERVAPTRTARIAWVAIGATLVVLCLGLFVLDPTPHLPPHYSVGLVFASLIALTAQCGALAACLRDQAANARRRAVRDLRGVDVAFDPALPIGRHRGA